MSRPIVIPTPKQEQYSGQMELEANCAIVVHIVPTAEQPARTTQIAAEQLKAWLKQRWTGTVTAAEQTGANPSYEINLVEQSDWTGSERYRIVSDEERMSMEGCPIGLLHAVQTLIQLLQPAAAADVLRMPLVQIEDEPDMPTRGIFAECFWGSDLMALQDWKEMIDEMVSFKLNTLSLGIYGCWPVRYPNAHNSRSEFLFASILDEEAPYDPQRRIHYFNPATGQEETLLYTPALYAHDTLFALFAYAVERGIRVIPQFNGPGHTRLLPRLYPHISSIHPNGKRTESGYSLTHPETFPLLKRMMQRIVERYMRPHNQTWFHIGMDEIEAWCANDLQTYTPRQLFELYLVEIGRFLLDLGMEKVIIWHDMGSSLTNYDTAFEQLLEEHGLAGKLVIMWWNYTHPVFPVKAVKGAEGWVAPSTGYLPAMFYQDYVDNIEFRVNDGMEHQFTGTVTYTLFSPTFRRNTAYLGEKTWNTAPREAASFERQYAAWLVTDQTAAWAKGMGELRKQAQYTSTFALLSELILFTGNGDASRPYPGRVLRSMMATAGVAKGFRMTRILLEQALRLFAEGTPVAGREAELEVNRFECRRIIGIIDGMLGLMDAATLQQRLADKPELPRGGIGDAAAKLEQQLEAFDALLMEMQHVLPHYLVPAALREYTYLRQGMRKQADELQRLAQDKAVQSGKAAVPPPSILTDTTANAITIAAVTP